MRHRATDGFQARDQWQLCAQEPPPSPKRRKLLTHTKLCSSRAISMLNLSCLLFSAVGRSLGLLPTEGGTLCFRGKVKLASLHSHKPQEAHIPLWRPYKYLLMRQKDEFGFSFSILFLWCYCSHTSNLFSHVGTLSLPPNYPGFS